MDIYPKAALFFVEKPYAPFSKRMQGQRPGKWYWIKPVLL